MSVSRLSNGLVCHGRRITGSGRVDAQHHPGVQHAVRIQRVAQQQLGHPHAVAPGDPPGGFAPGHRVRPRLVALTVRVGGVVEAIADIELVGDAVEIVPAPVGELSVAWNEYLGRWIMIYLDEPQRGLVIRDAPALTGPWSDTQMLVDSRDYPSLYGAYLHPLASSGETIYFNMSQWGPYNVMLMRARLVRADEVAATSEPE